MSQEHVRLIERWLELQVSPDRSAESLMADMKSFYFDSAQMAPSGMPTPTSSPANSTRSTPARRIFSQGGNTNTRRRQN